MNDYYGDFGLEDPIDSKIETVINFLRQTPSPFSGNGNKLELLYDWNTSPYGNPSPCKEYLLIYLDEKYLEFKSLRKGVELLIRICNGITK